MKMIQNIRLFEEIKDLSTEQSNQNSKNIDVLAIEDVLRIINSEDKTVSQAVENVIPQIAIAVEKIVQAFNKGASLIYVGAGTSGRLGVVDASECPPTFGASPEMVKAIIAGGKDAMYQAQEGIEDSEINGEKAVENIGLSNRDVLCAIAASGRTPFVLGAMKKAKEIGAFVVFLTTSEQYEGSKANGLYDLLINPVVGAEVVRGSTRMKSGTAQKMVLNMLTTVSFIKIGKVYDNVMIDLQLKNAKLIERAKNTLVEICDISYLEACELLEISGGNVKKAIVIQTCGVDVITAEKLLKESNGFVKVAIKKYFDSMRANDIKS